VYTQDCRLSECLPPHPATDAAHRDALAAAMGANGWAGRPLLGWWDEASDAVYLLTGSHRYAAACKADLGEVPVALVEVVEGRLEAHCEELRLDGERLSDFCGGALLSMLREEDPDAAELLAADCSL
jgi:hypothetical protein